MTARCLIPAAGRGARLAPVTSVVPKALLPVGTRPLLQWCLTEALEAGFDEIDVVTGEGGELLERWLESGAWREGILASVATRAAKTEIGIIRQERPAGVVDAVLAAADWADRAFAVFLPDNVRIAGPPPLPAALVAEAEAGGFVLAACHRVGPEARRYFGDVGRIELQSLVPSGARPAVEAIQERGAGAFRAAPEGSWRLAPRVAVTAPWMDAARAVRAEAELRGTEADDVEVLRRLVERGALRAAPWSGTLVDAGHPAGYLYAQHLLHEAAAGNEGDSGEGLVSIEI